MHFSLSSPADFKLPLSLPPLFCSNLPIATFVEIRRKSFAFLMKLADIIVGVIKFKNFRAGLQIGIVAGVDVIFSCLRQCGDRISFSLKTSFSQFKAFK